MYKDNPKFLAKMNLDKIDMKGYFRQNTKGETIRVGELLREMM